MNENGDAVYESKNFFYKEKDKIVYNSYGSIINGNNEARLIIDGVLLEDYRPSIYKAYGLHVDIKNKIAKSFETEEVFSYDEYDVTSKLFQNNKLCKSKRKFRDGKIKMYEEIIFSNEEEPIGSKQCILNGSVLRQITKNTSETLNEYKYFKIDDCCCLLSYNDWDNSPAIKIEISDEIVYLKSRIVENIKYPINLFDFPMF